MSGLNAKAARVLRKLDRTGKIAVASARTFITEGYVVEIGSLNMADMIGSNRTFRLTDQGRAALAAHSIPQS